MANFWFYDFPKSQLFTTIPEPTYSFQDQTIIITGANTGLGFEAARQIAHLGAGKVILACRSVAKGEAAAAKILASFGAKDTKPAVKVWELDISSYKSIKAFTQQARTLDRLDAVIQNAGVVPFEFEVAEESGEEKCLTTNLTGAVLFGLSMLPLLRESAKKTGCRGRLTFVGSDLHYVVQVKEAEMGKPIYEALNDPQLARISARYAVTKLLLFLAVKEISSRSPISPESNVIITVQTPGSCYSDLGRNEPRIAHVVMAVFRAALARSTEIGGRTLVHAVNPKLEEEAHGKFLMNCEIAGDPDLSLQKRFTDELFAKLDRIEPGVTSCLA